MDLDRLKLALEPPRLIVPPSGWLEHIPLALVMVDLLMPRQVVELGTFHGHSYCAFCQAVDELGLRARCTAIDTWRGDRHAGHYGPEVLGRLKAHHDPRYGEFSTLRESRFDDAVGEFAPGSIDLLHIDGLHTYSAVRHDFETWRSRLSSRGVVLFHDTQARRRGFGVWRFWREVESEYPSFEFQHGNGLGVLAVGGEMVPEMGEFLGWARREPVRLRGMFGSAGRLITLARQGALLCERGDTDLLPEWRVRVRAALAAAEGGWQGAGGDLRARLEAMVRAHVPRWDEAAAETASPRRRVKRLMRGSVGKLARAWRRVAGSHGFI